MERLGSAQRAQQQVLSPSLGDSGLCAVLPPTASSSVCDCRALRMTCILRSLPSDLGSYRKRLKRKLVTLSWGCCPRALPGGFWSRDRSCTLHVFIVCVAHPWLFVQSFASSCLSNRAGKPLSSWLPGGASPCTWS